MSVAPESGRNRIMIYGPRNDGTYNATKLPKNTLAIMNTEMTLTS